VSILDDGLRTFFFELEKEGNLRRLQERVISGGNTSEEISLKQKQKGAPHSTKTKKKEWPKPKRVSFLESA
jgi:hypothetical protein